ncbi:Gastrula zinc finger [Paramuricea clavata]|uniref:Gastrula zinc finger n=1 Tax=Paramuricea clavata TaxID=317549 RepID=A0A6S7I4W5_PARCT|nr:Gastrula zinc finger [Paramuricea clavata]
MDPLNQMTASRQVVRGILVNELKRMGGLKYTETLKVRMSKEIGDGKTKEDSVYFKSKTGTATNFEDIESTAAQNQLTILSRIETFQNLGSNWIILNIESHYVNIAMYKPLRGSSYMKLPGDISNPKCGLINMKNNDNLCFLWSHVRHLRPKARRATTITRKDREFITNLDYDGIDFPVKISDIDKIERKNSINISVFGYKGKKQFYPIRNSKAKHDEHMELLLLGGSEGNNHYVLIKDVNRMLFSVSKHTNKKHFCLHCLHSCVSKEVLEKHKETCLEVNGTQAVNLPKEGTKIKFKNHRNSMPVPFVIYADFESILVPEERKVNSKNPEDKSSTDLYQTHKACSFGLKTVCHYDDKYSGEYKSYVGEDAALVFLKTVLKESFRCREMVNNIFKKKMVITPKQEFEFQAARNCSICGNDLGEDRVRDHDHVTGMYRGAAHNICNLKYRITWKVPVVFHNLRGYDSHLIMQEIGKFKMDVNMIPNNMEKYISFSLGKNLVFIDSIQFMASSLEALVSNLSPEDFRIVGKRWKGEDFNIVTQKGVFPYEFLDNINKLNTEDLPSRDKFYSSLYESEVKEEDYQRAQKVWDHFKMKTLRDYHDLYLETDVLLLADVFENFRRTCLESYELDPAHYMSAPGLSWDAFLKQSGEEIELVSDMDMFQFFEKDSPYYSTHNKKVIGKFKDEAEGVPIIEFVGLRSKMYSYVKENGGGGMTAKGVKKCFSSPRVSLFNIQGVVSNLLDGRVDETSRIIQADCHKALQEVSSSKNASERGTLEHVLPSLQLNSIDINVLSDVTNANSKVCLCAVYQHDNQIIVENPLSRFVTDLIRKNNCTHFEVQVKVKMCKSCKANNVKTTYASQEFECTLTSPIASFDENRPLQLRRVNCQPETPFQAFLTKSNNIIQAEGNFIRIISKICENGKKVRIKLRFDVRSSVKRRSKSLSDFDSMKTAKKFHEEPNSFRNISGNCLAKSSASLGKAQSAITILDGEVNIQDYEKSKSTIIMQETLAKNTESQVDEDVKIEEAVEVVEVDEIDEVDGFPLDGLEKLEIFATGKFGPLYKVSRKGREQLVKIVKTDTGNEHFLEEARQFLKCRHPYIRPTADILEHHERYFVVYWFLDGHSLFQVIEENVIKNYVIYCRILFGMVKGLVYLRRIGIECQYLTPEKVLLDSRFNPRISGVGKSYFKSQEHTETNHGDFHRSLSYLDVHLRSKEEKHSKNVLWSVGRCMLF